jgi:hypothetical protein
MQSDIAKILEEVKLPESHGPAAKQPKPEKTFDTALAGSPAKPTPPKPAPTPSTSDETNKAPSEGETAAGAPGAVRDDLRSLHTLKDDLQHVVRESKISYVRAIALQEEKRHKDEGLTGVPAARKKRSMFALFMAVLLFGAGALALVAVYVVMQQRSGQSSSPLASSVLFAEQTVPFPVDNEAPGDILRTLGNARLSNTLTLGAILQIVPVHTAFNAATGQTSATPLSFGEFLDTLGTHAPADLAYALGDSFFFGIHTVDENAPIFVIPVASYERAFAAMLAWEPTMNADMAPLFTLLSAQAIGPNGLPIERKFEDTVMRNYDVRALKDDTGEIQMYYSFPSRTILIIAESPFSFTEILSRLRADRRL